MKLRHVENILALVLKGKKLFLVNIDSYSSNVKKRGIKMCENQWLSSNMSFTENQNDTILT